MLVIEAINKEKITADRVYPVVFGDNKIADKAYKKVFNKQQRL